MSYWRESWPVALASAVAVALAQWFERLVQ